MTPRRRARPGPRRASARGRGPRPDRPSGPAAPCRSSGLRGLFLGAPVRSWAFLGALARSWAILGVPGHSTVESLHQRQPSALSLPHPSGVERGREGSSTVPCLLWPGLMCSGAQPAINVQNVHYPRNTTVAPCTWAKCHPRTLHINRAINLILQTKNSSIQICLLF